MSGFTKGQWLLDRDDRREEYMVYVPGTVIGKRCIATVAFGYSEPADSEQHANAKLLAAAPELYEALNELLPHIKMISNEGWDAVATARAALAKVTGEEK